MHFYGILRGRANLCRRFKENCEDVFVPWVDVVDEKGNKEPIFVQLIPRKVELIEFVFPEQHLAQILKTFFPWANSTKDIKEKQLRAFGLQKILGAKKIPEMDLSKIKPFTCREGDPVRIPYADLTPIGIKEDKKNEEGVEIL